MLFKLAYKSLLNRKLTVCLTILTISVSVFVLLGVEHTRHQAKNSFSKTISGIDLIAGPRTGQLNLLLYSVFQMGNPSNNVTWQTYETFAHHPDVAWSIPISIGDSHKGYRVIATNTDYFKHFKYGQNQALAFESGDVFAKSFDAVIGASVASKLHYQIGDTFVVSHGLAHTSFVKHEGHPFKITGILKFTGTPVDQAIFVDLGSLATLHETTHQLPSTQPDEHEHEHEHEQQHHDAESSQITAFYLGLKTKVKTLQLQREINEYQQEALSAILPGVAITELWKLMGSMENLFRIVAWLVFMASILGMSTMLLTSMKHRQPELATLRTIGAHPSFIFFLIELEALLMTLIGTAIATGSLWMVLFSMKDFIQTKYGLFIDANFLTLNTIIYLMFLFIIVFLLGMIPALSAYRSVLYKK